MGRVTVGYQDACVYPLWLSRVNVRLARLMGASALWVPDHFMGFTPAEVWRPEVTPAARVVPSIDALFDPLQMLAVTATRIRGIDLGTSVTESIRRHPMSLAQSFVTLDHISKGRAILGIGNGIRENTEPYGLPYAQNVARRGRTAKSKRARGFEVNDMRYAMGDQQYARGMPRRSKALPH